MQFELNARFDAVETFVNEASTANVSERVQSYLFRLGTVLICGNLERSIEIIILERLATRAHPRVLNFVKSHFQRGTNFDCSAVRQLLQRFDPDWYRAFSTFVENNPPVEAGIASCYSVRNSVAHGGAMSVGEKRLKELLQLSRVYIDAIVECTRN
jgi:RiboL-PSP-HEPN